MGLISEITMGFFFEQLSSTLAARFVCCTNVDFQCKMSICKLAPLLPIDISCVGEL